MISATVGDVDSVNLLLGGDVKACISDASFVSGCTALMCSIKAKMLGVAEALLSYKVG